MANQPYKNPRMPQPSVLSRGQLGALKGIGGGGLAQAEQSQVATGLSWSLGKVIMVGREVPCSFPCPLGTERKETQGGLPIGRVAKPALAFLMEELRHLVASQV